MGKFFQIGFQENLIIGPQGFGQPFGHLLANGALAILHFRDMARFYSDNFREFFLRQTFTGTKSAQGVTNMKVGKNFFNGN